MALIFMSTFVQAIKTTLIAKDEELKNYKNDIGDLLWRLMKQGREVLEEILLSNCLSPNGKEGEQCILSMSSD